MRTIGNIIIVVFYSVGVWWFAYACAIHGERAMRPKPTITEQVKSIQRQVGCLKIDAKIGPETTALVNTAVRLEEQQKFNQYANRYMTDTGGPK